MTKQSLIISPSILSADFAYLADDVNKVVRAGAEWIHVDVMDNHFVPNLTFGALICQSLRNANIQAPLDVHLMIQPVDAILPDFAKAGATSITFHPEATPDTNATIDKIKALGCQVGLAVNPDTNLELILPHLAKLDLVLVMSVFPGFAGQAFIPDTLNHMRQLRQAIDATGKNIRLSVDGGVSLKNIGDVLNAGADTVVMGSAIFNAASPESVIQNALNTNA